MSRHSLREVASMSGSFALVILLFVSAFPMLLAYAWIARRRPSFGLKRFLLAAAVGLIAVVFAALIQFLLPRTVSGVQSLLFRVFFTIATVEEGAKYIALRVTRRFFHSSGDLDVFFSRADGASVGMMAGFGFALFETAAFASADFRIAFVRAISAVPLHAACGARIGNAVFSSKPFSLSPIISFITAIALHGLYDLGLVLPGYPIAVPLGLAFIAFFSSLALIPSDSNP